jgi:hypothetical protein
MTKKNWLSGVVFIAMSTAGIVLLLTALVSMVAIPLRGDSGFLAWLVLLLLIFAASRFTVSITTTDGLNESRKSVADTFVFLAVMLYAIPPIGTPGPAILLATVVRPR